MVSSFIKSSFCNVTSTFEASITATRTETDETDPQNPVIISTDVYSVSRAPIETTQQQLAVAQEILAKRQTEKDANIIIQNFVSALKASGKQYLEANDNG